MLRRPHHNTLDTTVPMLILLLKLYVMTNKNLYNTVRRINLQIIVIRASSHHKLSKTTSQ